MLSRYIELQNEILVEKQKILHKLIGSKNEVPKMQSGKLYFAMFTDITDSWSVKDIHKNVQKRLNKESFEGEYVYIPQTEKDSIEENIMRSKDLVMTLSTMLQYGNTTKSKGLYFHKLSDSTLSRIAEILQHNFIPQTKQTKNISGVDL